MNNEFDSPLEALALNYLSFGFLTAVNSIWTWVAVLTGAVSFILTIRKPALSITGAVLPNQETRTLDPVPAPGKSADTLDPAPAPGKSSYPLAMSADATALPVRAEEGVVDWTTRGKYTVYYEDDVAEAGEEYDVAEAGEECDVHMDVVGPTRAYATKSIKNTSSTQIWYKLNDLSSRRDKFGSAQLIYTPSGCEWDGMLRMRILTGEEMGWYCYQDLTVLDGNVVRLWDGCR